MVVVMEMARADPRRGAVTSGKCTGDRVTGATGGWSSPMQYGKPSVVGGGVGGVQSFACIGHRIWRYAEDAALEWSRCFVEPPPSGIERPMLSIVLSLCDTASPPTRSSAVSWSAPRLCPLPSLSRRHPHPHPRPRPLPRSRPPPSFPSSFPSSRCQPLRLSSAPYPLSSR